MFRRDDILLTVLLSVSLFAPTSIHGDYSLALLGASLSMFVIVLAILYWQHGYRTSILWTVSLPIMILLSVCTFLASSFRFGWGVFAQWNLLALTFAMDLREMRPGPLTAWTFKIVNVVYIAWGIALVVGSEAIGQFTSGWYAQFYDELLPNMLWLHKPVLAFGTHSLAGFFVYLLFFLNWRHYTSIESRLSLSFSIFDIGLLLALRSFTSLALGVLALAQVMAWLWKRNRRALILGMSAFCGAMWLAYPTLAEQLDRVRAVAPGAITAFLNSEASGPLARYGANGDLGPSISYLADHPLSPVGYTVPSFLFFADSGPLEYMLRGSVPLLCLMYIGLYVFLRHNCPSRTFSLMLFLAIVAFEMGFVSLTYFRTLLFLPFLAIYPKYFLPASS